MLLSIIFTAIFLTGNHLYSTFASPMVSNGGGKSPNLTHSLAKRDYAPADVLCDQGADEWVSRSCLSMLDDRTWMDTCLTDEEDERVYVRIGSCPVNTICMNTYIQVRDEDDETLRFRTIMCIGRPFDETERAHQAQSSTQTQTGVYTIDGTGQGPREHIVPVQIRDPISAASVSALIEGTNGTYVVAANKDIVGSWRGTTTKPCSYNETNRDCVPTDLYDFDGGNMIDFTFGLSEDQSVRFYYAIIGSEG